MRRAPQYLTYFFIVISVQRVAEYIANALHVPYMGWPFAIGIAFAIYVGMWYQGEEKTKKTARQTAWMFIIVDLIFNEMELVRNLSATTLLTPDSNFLGISHGGLTTIMQVTAVLFGAIPTLAVAFLGRLQNDADDHWKGKPTNGQRIGNAFAKMVANTTGWIAFRVEGLAMSRSGGVPQSDRSDVTVATRKRWKDLTADDVAFITANGRTAIMARYGISDGAAGNWKSDLLAGKRPWTSAKLPAKVP